MNYAPYNAYSGQPNHLYSEQGPVKGTSRSFYSLDCKRTARAALSDALDEAKAVGGNALANVVWVHDDEKRAGVVTCNKAMLVYVWWVSAHVEATSLTLKEGGAPPGAVLFDPSLPTDAEAARILAMVWEDGT